MKKSFMALLVYVNWQYFLLLTVSYILPFCFVMLHTSDTVGFEVGQNSIEKIKLSCGPQIIFTCHLSIST